MAFDEDLADRIRELLGDESRLSEQRMFGGLAFLIGGNMAVVASGRGGIMVRADKEESQRLIDSTPATLMVMRGRPMPGWLRVGPEHLRTKRELGRWVRMGAAYARSLPPKQRRARRR